jgi:xanthine/CO dehydrogenase XdhC/CoxF family maturation factor
MDINSDTPEEIAVSIAAEIIDVKKQKLYLTLINSFPLIYASQ